MSTRPSCLGSTLVRLLEPKWGFVMICVPSPYFALAATLGTAAVASTRVVAAAVLSVTRQRTNTCIQLLKFRLIQSRLQPEIEDRGCANSVPVVANAAHGRTEVVGIEAM